MFGAGLQALGARVGDPLDYLDKIFQVPFSLTPMTHDRAADLVRALVADPVAGPPSGRPTSPQGQAPAPAGSLVPSESDGPSFAGHDMHLTPEEVRVLARVSGIIRTPRGVKRLVNLYRLVRVGRLAVDDPTFGLPGSDACRAVAYLLAAIVGMPAVATRVLSSLAESHGTLASVLEAAGIHHRAEDDREHHPERCGWCSDLQVLSTATLELLEESFVPADPAVYGKWLAEVARYSFHSAELQGRLSR